MNVYEPPSTEIAGGDARDGGHSEDRDLEAVKPTRRCVAAGGIAIATALYLLLLAFQTMAAVHFRGALVLIVPTMALAGMVLLVLGWYVRKHRGWATMGSLAVSCIAALLGMAWFVFSLTIGLLTLMPLIVVAAAGISAVMSALCVKSARNADEARTRLAAQDLRF